MTATWRRRLLEALLFILVIGAVYAWRAHGLLPADARTIAPRLDLVDLSGRRWTTESLRGRPAVLYFFAPWCGVCSASSPQLRWFDRWAGDRVQVVLVGLDWSTTREIEDYAARHRLRMPVLAGDSATAAAFHIRGYPTYYVLDARGRVAGRDFGYTTAPGLWLRTRGL